MHHRRSMLLSKSIKICVGFLIIICGFYGVLFSMRMVKMNILESLFSWKNSAHNAKFSSRLSICMMLPVTSRGIIHNLSLGPRLIDLPLVHTFIPSFLKTIEDKYDYRLYLGYDYNDAWYDNEKNLRDLVNLFDTYMRNASWSGYHVELRPIMLFGIDKRITAIWNTLAATAYKDLCDYFYPANDDLQFRTKGWTSAAVHELEKCVVASNFGVVAFRDLSACSFPTFHLTHRTHLDLHDGIYYPLPAHGAHQDPWIFGMYRIWNCAFFLPQYELRNHVGISVTARYEYGNGSQLVYWITRSRRQLYNRLLSSSRYDQDFIKPSNLYSQMDWTVPCEIRDERETR